MLRYLVCTLGLGLMALCGMSLLSAQEPGKSKAPGTPPPLRSAGSPAGKGVPGGPGVGMDKIAPKGVGKDRMDPRKGWTLVAEKFIISGRDKNRVMGTSSVPDRGTGKTRLAISDPINPIGGLVADKKGMAGPKR